MRRRNEIAGLRRFLAVLIGICMLAALAGCDSVAPETREVVVERSVGADVDATPVTKTGGGKFRVGLVDTDEYAPASVYLYHVAASLRSLGWISCDALPFTESELYDTDQIDVQKMARALAAMDLGPYLEFDEDLAFLLYYDGEEETEAALRGSIASGDGPDLLLAMGTVPGQYLKDLDLGVPTLVCMATDPVEAGIINSPQDSGNENIWAQVEPSPYYRQIKFYHDALPFTNAGMVYNNAVIAGIADYERGTKELGVTLTKQELKRPEGMAQETYTESLLAIYDKMIREDGIDAYILNADLITGSMPFDVLIEPFRKAGIPVFVQDGENYVRDGALMLVASTDNRGVGSFIAQTMAQVFRGAKPGSLACEYVSSPYLCINLETARSIGYQPSFAMLLSCESIY